MAIDFILRRQGVVQFHDFEDGRHRLVVETLPISHILHLALELVIANQNLLNVFQVPVVFPAEPLELFLEPVSRLFSLIHHACKVVAQLELGLREGHHIDRQLFVLLSQHLCLCIGDALA